MSQKRPTQRQTNKVETSPKHKEENKEDSIKKEIECLQKNIASVENTILNDDDDCEESSWRLMKKAYEEQLEQKKKELVTIENEKINNFIKKATNNRRRSNKDNRKTFHFAKKDAESRVFSIIALPVEEIAQCFSTSSFFIDPWQGPVRPPKFVYSWYHDLRKRENNLIPLSPGIEVPKKRDVKTGQVRDIQFLISFFYSDPKFLEMCQSYYKPFGITITIKKDKKYNRKWWIKLKVDNPENKILFPQYNQYYQQPIENEVKNENDNDNEVEKVNENDNDNDNEVEKVSLEVGCEEVGWENSFEES